MDSEIARRTALCREAQNPDWSDIVTLATNLNSKQREFLAAHPPGLVGALWEHFQATQANCGCSLPSHEKPGCSVSLIERLLADEQSI